MATPPAPTAVVPPRPQRSFFRRLWSFIVFLLVVGAWAAAGFMYMQLRRERAAREALDRKVAEIDPKFEKFKSAVREVDRQLSATVYQEIDLGASGWQPIAGGFYLIDLVAMQEQPNGVKVSGKVINPTSVTHDAAQFSARMGDRRGTFTLPHVPPGVAQTFEVAIPGVLAAAPRRAYFALDSSTISFASSTTRKRVSTGPMDTDKLLK